MHLNMLEAARVKTSGLKNRACFGKQGAFWASNDARDDPSVDRLRHFYAGFWRAARIVVEDWKEMPTTEGFS